MDDDVVAEEAPVLLPSGWRVMFREPHRNYPKMKGLRICPGLPSEQSLSFHSFSQAAAKSEKIDVSRQKFFYEYVGLDNEPQEEPSDDPNQESEPASARAGHKSKEDTE